MGPVSRPRPARAWRDSDHLRSDQSSCDEEEENTSRLGSSADDEVGILRQPEASSGYDSGQEEEQHGDEQQPQAPPRGPAEELSSWFPTRKNVRERPGNAVRLTLQSRDTLAFMGQYELQVVSGGISLYGAIFTPASRSRQVFAPITHPIPMIKGLSGQTEIEIRPGATFITELSDVVSLYRKIWTKTPNRHCRSSPDNHESRLPDNASFSFIKRSSEDARSLQALRIPDSWKIALHDGLRPGQGSRQQVLVTGRKGHGKSTFCRLLANTLLTCATAFPGPEAQGSDDISQDQVNPTVCWLDLDPGQSEFSPAGQISLIHLIEPILGPPFTHAFAENFTANKLVHAHCIAASSPIDDAQYYLHCAADLQERYKTVLQNFPDCPLIINCPGWSSKGFGFELALQILQTLWRTDVVMIGSDGHEVHRALFDNATKSDRLHAVSSVESDRAMVSLRTAAELREMQMISYLHSTPLRHHYQQWLPTPIERQESWSLLFGGDDRDILGISTQGTHPPNSELLSVVLDKWILGICIVEDDEEVGEALANLHLSQTDRLPYWPIEKGEPVYRPSIANSKLLGWAYLKKIDVQHSRLELVAPLSQLGRRQALQKTESGISRLVLIRGQTDSPSWAYLESTFVEARKKRSEDAPRIGKELAKTTERKEDIELDLSELPAVYDLGATHDEKDEMDYVRKTTRGQATAAGAKAWTERPRITERRSKRQRGA